MKSGLLRCVYSVSGKNIDYLVEFLHRKGVSVYSFNKTSQTTAKICIDFKQRNKLFAICNNMSYNITKVYYKGLLSPFKTALCYIGFFIGVLLFTSICFFLEDVIFSIEVTGSGACFSNQTIAEVTTLNVKPLKKFSSFNFKEVESKILSNNKMLSFVSLKKQGNRLIINAELNESYLEPLNKESGDIISNVNGVIESIVVLRGTQLKAVGDTVYKGEPIVKAVITDNSGNEYPTFIVARILVIESQTFTFKLKQVDENSVLLAKKTAEFNAKGEVVNSQATVENGFVTVTVYVRHVLYGG